MTDNPVDSTWDIHGCSPRRSPQGDPEQMFDKARIAMAKQSGMIHGGNRVATFGIGEFAFPDISSANR